MEDWIDILKERLQEAKATLPPNDWEEFEAASLPAKRTRVLPWLIPALAAAAAALFVVLKPREKSVTVPEHPVVAIERIEPDIPVTLAEVLPSVTTPASTVRRPEAVPALSSPVDSEADTAEDCSDDPPVEQIVPQGIIPQEESSRDDAFALEPPFVMKPRRRFMVSPHIGGPGSRNGIQSNGPFDHLSNDYQLYTGYPASLGQGLNPNRSWSAQHSLPLSVGLEISYFPASRLALTSGLELSFYRSTFHAPAMTDISVRQQAYYLGIPLRMDWVAFQSGRWSAWLGAGGEVDRCVRARVQDRAVQDNAFHWSVMADASLQYALTQNLGLYIQPEVSYFFKPADPALLTYRTEHPLMFTVGAGFRIGF